jgi:hypothetical protein
LLTIYNSFFFKYKGPGIYDEDVATIRANHPIPPKCSLFYFEVDIIDKGDSGYVA